MKVKELMSVLNEYDPEMEVVTADIWHDMPRYRELRTHRVVSLYKDDTARNEPKFVEPNVQWFGFERKKNEADKYLLLWVGNS
jgi:hypothetical protein